MSAVELLTNVLEFLVHFREHLGLSGDGSDERVNIHGATFRSDYGFDLAAFAAEALGIQRG